MIYGFTRRGYSNQWPVNYAGEDVTEGCEYLLFAVAKSRAPAPPPAEGQAEKAPGRKGRGKKAGPRADAPLHYTWSHDVPLKVRALVLAGDVLLAAGLPDLGPADKDPLATWEGRQGGLLSAFSARDGAPQGQWKLDALPVWDGLAAAEGCVVLSTSDGQVRCFTGSK